MAIQKSNTGAKKDDRRRNFATVVYPESASDNWIEVLGELCIPAFISPLHDQDVNPTGEIKKAHYHVILMFEGKKSQEQVREILEKINGVGIEEVQSLRGYARYLCHLDNPEKAQYNVDDVVCVGGADYTSIIDLPKNRYKAIKEMMAYCTEHDIYAYSDLLEYASENHMDWFRVLCDSGTIVIKEYLKSKSWKAGRISAP